MLKKDLIAKSPVTNIIGLENITDGKFGAVLSRAGVGKTSFLVQIAMVMLLDDKKILHISLDDTMEKINIRYSEGFNNLIDHIGYIDPQKSLRLWEDLKDRKVGISYNENTFDIDKIRDYLKSFKKTGIELPSIIIIDGLDFDKDISAVLDNLEKLNEEFGIFTWMSMKSHRDEKLSKDGFPVQLENHKDRYEKAIFLRPVGDKIEGIVLKDGDMTDQKQLLDPSTMMMLDQ